MFVINKDKVKAIVFIHGFYANAGFWLNYMDYFKEYCLIFLDIDFLNKYKYETEKTLFNEILKKNGYEIIAIISHSLGTFFSSTFALSKNIIQYDICPIGIGRNVNESRFVNSISLKTNKSEEIILNDLKLIEYQYFKASFFENSDNKILYIPDSDDYFSYDDSVFLKIHFSGDHFNINNAIIDIKIQLESISN
jgi:hypothetical protein